MSAVLCEQEAMVNNNEYLIIAENIGSSFYKSIIIYKNKVITPKVFNQKLSITKPKDGSLRLLLTHRDNRSILFISKMIEGEWQKIYDSINGINNEIKLTNEHIIDLDYYRNKFPNEIKWLLNKDSKPKDYPKLPLKYKVNIDNWT